MISKRDWRNIGRWPPSLKKLQILAGITICLITKKIIYRIAANRRPGYYKILTYSVKGQGPSIKDVGNFWPFQTPSPHHIDPYRLLNDPSLNKTSSGCNLWPPPPCDSCTYAIWTLFFPFFSRDSRDHILCHKFFQIAK